MDQLTLGFGVVPANRKRLIDPVHSPVVREQWSDRFRSHLGDRLFRVVFHDNSSTMITSKHRHGILEIRLHHMFIEADDNVLPALANFLLGRRSGSRVLDRFIERNGNRIGRPNRRRRVRGLHYDLKRIRDAVNRTYFDGRLDTTICWGRASRGSRRSIRLGSYSFDEGLIRIHPVLDQAAVPPSVVVAVVHHEMLHCALGARRQGGRRMVHTREFRERERNYLLYDRSVQWEKDHLVDLLRNQKRST